MYVFARRPKWIVSHLLVLLAVVTMIGMGLWQLDRLGQRKDRNAEVTARTAEPVVEVASLVSVTDDNDVGEVVRWREVTATGEYRAEDEVLILARPMNAAEGYWALTPLVLADGTAVAVNRGWVPFDPGPGEARPDSAPPAGPVTVTGLARETVEPSGLQSADPSEGVLEALARPDLARFEQQLDYPLLPVYIQLQTQSPAGLGLPVALGEPELDEGPHLSYAFQWLVFTIIAVVGYPLVLRRVARSEGKDRRHSDIPVDYL